MLALKYHPDKNKSEEACRQFQEIHEAYVYLSTNTNDSANIIFNHDEYMSSPLSPSPFTKYLSAFLQVLFKTGEQQEIAEKICEIVYNKIGEKAAEKSLEFLENVDRRLLKIVYTVLSKYQQVLNIDCGYLDKIGVLLQTKFEKDERILLYPSLKDLFEANLFKLRIDDTVFLVPLWHHELIYDNSDAELTVECMPELPENMAIDENNNLHVTLKYAWTEITQMEWIEFVIDGVGSLFKYPVENLNIVHTQTRVLGGVGIPRIDKHDIYEIGKRGDIYLHICIY